MKVPVIQRDEYTVFFECFEGRTFVHCDVHDWKPSVHRRLASEFDILVVLHDKPVFAIDERDDPKHVKWLKMFGFKYDATAECRDGKTRDIYVRQ